MAKTLAQNGSVLTPAKARSVSASQRRGVVPSAELVSLQFKMPADFVKAFKQEALNRDMKLNQLLSTFFDASGSG